MTDNRRAPFDFQRRNQALRELDLNYFRGQMPIEAGFIDDHTALMSMHKARYEVAEIERPLRIASADWLRAHGCGRFNGRPLLPPGELP